MLQNQKKTALFVVAVVLVVQGDEFYQESGAFRYVPAAWTPRAAPVVRGALTKDVRQDRTPGSLLEWDWLWTAGTFLQNTVPGAGARGTEAGLEARGQSTDGPCVGESGSAEAARGVTRSPAPQRRRRGGPGLSGLFAAGLSLLYFLPSPFSCCN